MVEREQALIARVLDLFARRFDKRAVLRGGMVLRILGSPRFTNDLDYIFVPHLPPEEIGGLAMQFRAALAKLR
jgi:hypothetical protein